MEQTLFSFERFAADQLLSRRDEIAAAWVDRIAADPCVGSHRLPRPEEVADPIREVLEQVAEFVGSDAEPPLTSNPFVVERVSRLARDRHHRGIEAHELIHEFDLLADLLDAACLEWMDRSPAVPARTSVLRVVGRLNRAPLQLAEIAIRALGELESVARVREVERIRTFANNLAHELKNPLGAAETAALVLEDPAITESFRDRLRFASVIQQSLRRARTVIEDLRKLALAESSAEAGDRRIPIGLVLADVLAEVRAKVHAAGLRVEIVEPIPDLHVDGPRVELILLNLIDNAIKYSNPDRPFRHVVLRVDRDEFEGLWWVAVSDNGLGIAPEYRPRVFERFFRAHADRAEGSGVGLAIVREAAEQMGSRLHVESEPGVGSTFRFSLPGR